ncbi:MAG: phosphonoacetaldehyde hydrolase [Deltaproteobacteria bacterium]|nr:phosphonoacetaldehyde hydrolase [bacterium]MCB9477146.1 phosphonoacetaldehyde hydrolase [Deltaproteobacteria bacterium]MCB9479132.1 phosphonoacetaldehyde hydrolase [Deltaproteobacteria bacterium]MCB9489197.1 phosphonoacetaldehyde hydrolase [Deltaproteobacteria bacterium]
MDFVYRRFYTGPIQAVVCDLAGTLVDYGSMAPAGAFMETFARQGVTITNEQARGPMGLHKKDHIREILRMAPIDAAFKEVKGRAWNEDDVQAMYEDFTPLQLAVLPKYGALIPGALEFRQDLAEAGVKFAANTGYAREMMQVVLEEAKKQDFIPDAALCADDVLQGRPAPWMTLRSMELMGVYPPAAVVKIGDTVPDVEEGLNAGVWTIGLAKSGNMNGMPLAEVEAMDEEALEKRLEVARRKLLQCGAHYVVDSIADCLEVLDEINDRLSVGENP